MVDITMGSTQKPLSSEELKRYFQENNDLEGYLYIGYPIIGTVEGPYLTRIVMNRHSIFTANRL